MNFNLISPEGNGYEYTIRFKEPIDVEPNSKIELNWAELTRGGKIVLKDPATISVSVNSSDVFPSKNPADLSDNKVFLNAGLPSNSLSASIPSGSYSFTEFALQFNLALESILTSNGAATADNNLAYYEPNNDALRFNISNLNQFAIGYELGNEYFNQSNASARNTFDATGSPQKFATFTVPTTTKSDSGCYYKTGGVNGTFDSFATDFSKNYFHYQMENFLHVYAQSNLIFLRGGQEISPGTGTGTSGLPIQEGRIVFGLYSKEYAQGVGTVPTPNRTAAGLANTISVDANGFPRNFVNVVIDKYDGNFLIQVAQNAGGEYINEFTSIGPECNMATIFNQPMSTLFDAGSAPQITFQTYIETETSNDFETSPRIYFRVFNSKGFRNDTAGDLIFDSITENMYIPYTFLRAAAGNAAGIDYSNAVEVNSQIPFNVSMYADRNNEGFRVCRFKSFTKGINTATEATFPQSIIERYTIELSSQLAKAIGFVSKVLHPNAIIFRTTDGSDVNNESLSRIVNAITDLDINWKQDNYSVYLDLPINSYKNVSSSQQGGYAKTILANLPSPFSTGVVLEPVSSDNQNVISTYQPYQRVVNEMKNNKLAINSLRVKIIDMKDETLSTELVSSILNFTITSPKQSVN